jgi:hypothetical protein
MLRIFNQNTLLLTLILTVSCGFMVLVVPMHVQADSNLSSLMNFASTCTPSGTVGQPSVCTDPATTCPTSDCDLIQEYVTPTINLLAATFGLIAVISLISGGINYTTSEGDPQKVSKAKTRIRNTIFSILCFMFLYAFLNFLIPGGIFQ